MVSNKITLKEAVMAALVIGGGITLAAVVPNALRILDQYQRHKRRTNPRYYMNRTLKELKAQGYITFQSNKKGHTVIKLTSRGEFRLERTKAKMISQKRPKKWDGKYRVVMFDIKEGRRQVRDSIRRELLALGFFRLQDSVWIYPYNCGEVVALLKSHFKIGKDVLYMVIETLENDREVREHFNLL